MNLDMFADTGLAGALAAASKADDTDPGWSAHALDDLRRYAQSADRPFTIEQARSHCIATPEGCDARTWGAITKEAIRRGAIKFAGYFCPAVSSHGSPKPMYERGDA